MLPHACSEYGKQSIFIGIDLISADPQTKIPFLQISVCRVSNQ
jgi:hypothetical protein